jgi:hypothetical protein
MGGARWCGNPSGFDPVVEPLGKGHGQMVAGSPPANGRQRRWPGDGTSHKRKERANGQSPVSE